ncbi:transposase [Escherichia coli]|uniref:transposase n=1 Tax=Escherichia coli TaxID=562 RepID=UPI002148BB1A|nr:transposase [Escherichia coli]MCR1066349.1 transposase [Escherichia coli]
MTKTVSTSKKPRKQHSPEFRSEALKLAERIGVTAAARELSLYESQLYNWRSKQQNQQTSSERELEMSTEIARLKRQLAERDEELAILQKAATYCEAPEMKYVFIENIRLSSASKNVPRMPGDPQRLVYVVSAADNDKHASAVPPTLRQRCPRGFYPVKTALRFTPDG